MALHAHKEWMALHIHMAFTWSVWNVSLFHNFFFQSSLLLYIHSIWIDFPG